MKRYLAFDIEALNQNPYAIGVVQFDETFTVLGEDEILVNPEVDGWGRMDKRYNGIKKSDITQMPNFQETFPQLKEIFGERNQTNIGYSVGNDLRFFNHAFDRYNIDAQIHAHDIQAIGHKMFTPNTKGHMGLWDFADLLNVDLQERKNHIAVDDAYVTMQSLKQMCDQTSLGPSELIKDLGIPPLDSKALHEWQSTKKLGLNMATRIRAIAEAMSCIDTIGNVFFSQVFKRDENFLELVKMLYENAHGYTENLYEADMFVAPKNGARKCYHENQLDNHQRLRRVKKLTMNTLCRQLGINNSIKIDSQYKEAG